MKRMINTTALFLICMVTYAKEQPKYPVSAISDEMKKGMYAVIREQEVRFEINSINNATTYHHIVITILNSGAKNYSDKVVGYDKFSSIKAFKGTAYDADGNVIKRLKQSEIYDQSSYDGSSMFSDNRLKRADLAQGSYPYTVEYEYEVEEKKLYFLPEFHLYYDDEISIQKSRFVIIYPPALKPRYKLFKIQEPEMKRFDGKEELEWTFENVRPEKFEKMGPDFSEVIPNIQAAPGDFEFDGYRGKMDTWDNFGKWITSLNNGRDELPEATKQKIKALTENAKTNEEKAKVLYEYLQSKTRYVGIQLGIGGFQPFKASVVDDKGYGDCKALSNYMVAMLKEAGIKAYYTLILAGEDESDLDVDFPSSQFNHAVVSVPNGKDTLWLECTSQTKPFGYMGTFTGDRKALLITENGGKIVNTIHYPAEVNNRLRSADVYIDTNGDATAKIGSVYSGLKYEFDNLDFILNDQYDNQKKWILENTGIPSFDVVGFAFANNKAKIPSAEVKLDLKLRRLASVSGKRLFITPNLMSRSSFIPEKTEQRKTDIVFKWGSVSYDTIRYHIPENIYPEFLPEPVKIASRFGEYEVSFKVEQGNVVYVRKLKVNEGRFPPSSYQELSEFYRSINKADNVKIVFLNKT
ncbi:MAG TPA: DUF3857 domain-containing protein [Cyclobacteriaceae bacterium]|nr:DUF3857 domain-containing protein [Cyclobacteriaceae bacterium]